METAPPIQEPILPIIRQPTGAKYFLGTWSGRIQVVNSLVFILMVIKSPSSLMLPDPDFIRMFGAKSVADIALGEYWRFFTPMFVHIGAIHFAFNTMGLNYIGYLLEYMLGGRWFILLYLLAGIVGNVSSSVFSVTASAGASGALFGLLGAGFVLEYSVGHRLAKHFGPRPRRRVYAGMVFLNIILGIFIPVIDNAAHLGGLVTGIAFVQALLWLRPNQLEKPRPVLGRAVIVGVLAATICGISYAVTPSIGVRRYLKAARNADSVAESWLYTQEALRINEHDPEALLWAGRILILADHQKEGLQAIGDAINRGASDDSIHNMIEELKLLGHTVEADAMEEMLSQRRVI